MIDVACIFIRMHNKLSFSLVAVLVLQVANTVFEEKNINVPQ